MSFNSQFKSELLLSAITKFRAPSVIVATVKRTTTMSSQPNNQENILTNVVKITAKLERSTAARTGNHRRVTREAEHERQSVDVACENGVCHVSWKPQRPAA